MQPWLLWSFALWIGLVATDLIYRKLFALGFDPLSLVVLSLVVGLPIALGFAWGTKKSVRVPRSGLEWALVLSTGVAFFFGFYVLRVAQKLAPNMGLVGAVAASSVVATMVLLWIFYKDPLTLKMMAGGLCILAGLAVLNSV